MSRRFCGPQGGSHKAGAKNKGVLAYDRIARRDEAITRYTYHSANLPCDSATCPYPLTADSKPRNSYQLGIKVAHFSPAPVIIETAPVAEKTKVKLKAKDRRKKNAGH